MRQKIRNWLSARYPALLAAELPWLAAACAGIGGVAALAAAVIPPRAEPVFCEYIDPDFRHFGLIDSAGAFIFALLAALAVFAFWARRVFRGDGGVFQRNQTGVRVAFAAGLALLWGAFLFLNDAAIYYDARCAPGGEIWRQSYAAWFGQAFPTADRDVVFFWVFGGLVTAYAARGLAAAQAIASGPSRKAAAIFVGWALFCIFAPKLLYLFAAGVVVFWFCCGLALVSAAILIRLSVSKNDRMNPEKIVLAFWLKRLFVWAGVLFAAAIVQWVVASAFDTHEERAPATAMRVLLFETLVLTVLPAALILKADDARARKIAALPEA